MPRFVEIRSEKNVSSFLRIYIGADNNGINISKYLLIESMYRRFFKAGAHEAPTPIAARTRINKYEDGIDTHGPDQELVGSLLFLANTVRPIINYLRWHVWRGTVKIRKHHTGQPRSGWSGS